MPARDRTPNGQEGRRAHSTNLDPANKFAIVADLGLGHSRFIISMALRASSRPTDPPAYSTAPGAGPRHFAFHPDGKRAFVINEINSTLTALDYDADRDVLTPRQTVSTLPSGFTGNSTCAEVVVIRPASSSTGPTAATTALPPSRSNQTASLFKPMGHQGEGVKTPRNFNIDPRGRWMIVANQDGDSLVVFRIDQKTGMLSPTGTLVRRSADRCA